MIIGDILLIIEGLLIAIAVNPITVAMSEVNLFFKILYFLCFIFGIIMLVVGIRGLKPDIHNYIITKKKGKE
jgi:hypothetical protein